MSTRRAIATRAPPDVAQKLVGELWLYPDGSIIVELSTKRPPDSALRTAVKVTEFLRGHGIDLSGEQQTKTKAALEYFADQLASAS